MSTTTPACKHSACLDSMLLYQVQGSDVSVHAILEYMQQAGITYEMPAPYKMASTYCCETHRHRLSVVGAGIPASIIDTRMIITEGPLSNRHLLITYKCYIIAI